MAKADRNPEKSYKWYQYDKYDQPPFKVTGSMETGRVEVSTGEKEYQQLPPKYFHNKGTAKHYLDNQVAKGTLWRLNPTYDKEKGRGKWVVDGKRVNPRSMYIAETFKNLTWPLGGNKRWK